MCSFSVNQLNGFGGKIIRREGKGFFEMLDAPGGSLYAIHLAGTHYEMGRQYGLMLGDRIFESCEIMKAMLIKSGLPEGLIPVIGSKAWSHYSRYVPDIYKRELEGILDGAAEKGVQLNLDMLETMAAVPELTGYWHMEEMIGKIISGPEKDIKPVWDGKERGSMPTQCSAFMAWGSRCEDGNLYGCRNLDWAKDTGIASNKCVTVFHPENEKGEKGVPSAVFGYIGVLGAMAGINAEGVALSEIGAYSMRETLEGRPWHYVFHEVLENAKNLDEAENIIRKGNYVQGYCFVAGWGDPRRKGTPEYAPKGMSIEVDAENIEILYDNDPGELEAVCVDTNGEVLLFDGKPVFYGMPLEQAVFRADTAFSKSVRSGQYTDKGPAGVKNSGNAKEGRTWRTLYQPISLMIKSVNSGEAFCFEGLEDWQIPAAHPHPMTRDEALNICKMAGDNSGNVMSILYDATRLRVLAAFETGSGETWTPASKSGYVELDLSEVFN